MYKTLLQAIMYAASLTEDDSLWALNVIAMFARSELEGELRNGNECFRVVHESVMARTDNRAGQTSGR
jgi:hypothetical protein